jgi:molybdenum cofactor guanylyltransferase
MVIGKRPCCSFYLADDADGLSPGFITHQGIKFSVRSDIVDKDCRLTIFVLAGGKSTRMGTDKGFLELEGRTLLARALELAVSIGSPAKIVGDPQKFSRFGQVVEDIYHDHGPLGGIQAALASTATELNLILAVDLPFLRSEFLQYLISRARETSAVVTVPRAVGGLQPLCAVYRSAFLPISERSLRAGKNKIDALFAEVETRVIDEQEIRNAGFGEGIFRNVNTPDDWNKAQAEL